MPIDPRDAPQSAARRLLSGGEWVSAAEYAELIRDSLTDEQAGKCFDRLARAGQKAEPADRIRIGRERLAQEALQRLVQRNEAEAVGSGSDRRYRLIHTGKAGDLMFAPRPKPRKEFIARERIRRTLDLQMREIVDPKSGECLTFVESWVQHLLELRDDGVQFEPIELVEEQQKGKEPILWLFHGFNRFEMWGRDGAETKAPNSVECLIYPGTFADAQFWACGVNGKQSLQRTTADVRKALYHIIDTPHLLAKVYGQAKETNGTIRGLAVAAGISKGAVDKHLKTRGLNVDRKTGKLVSIPTVQLSPPPPPPASPARASEPDEDGEDEKPKPQEPEVTVAPSGPVSEFAVELNVLERITKGFRSLDTDITSLLRSPVGNRIRNAAKGKEIPFHVETKDVDLPVFPKAGDDMSGKKRIETWPAWSILQAVFAQVKADLASETAQDEHARGD